MVKFKFFRGYVGTLDLMDGQTYATASFIRKRDNHTCVRCGKKSHRLQVHHTKYEDGLMPWEYDNNTLESLCSHCHKKEHNIKPKKKKLPRKKKSVDDVGIIFNPIPTI